jgi:2-dehydro-3-deoxygluconokinase
MVELREQSDGTLTRGHGGDTLNTAVYLSRLGMSVDYVTALGNDSWSDEMVAQWRSEGIGTRLVRRVEGRLPGLYIIQTDRAGERRFVYWRDSAAARILFDLPDAAQLGSALAQYDLLYFSGITLSIYSDPGRIRLFAAVDAARDRGGKFAFDTNFRPRGWPDLAVAKTLYRHRASGAERVLKLAWPAVKLAAAGTETIIEAAPVKRLVDTTAAGDSFAAAYLAVRLRGGGPVAAAQAGHRLAGAVVGFPGAIIPRDAMPTEAPP